MKKHVIFLFLMIIGLGSASFLFPHGITSDIRLESPFVVLQPKYSGGQPTAGASVTVLSPGREEPFLEGACDAAGQFVFIPDKAGEWTVVVDDGRGHRLQKILAVEEAFFTPKAAPKAEPAEPQVITKEVPYVPLWIKVFLGLSIIFGLTGLLYGLKTGREAKSVHEA
jgi:nickel transport protein